MNRSIVRIIIAAIIAGHMVYSVEAQEYQAAGIRKLTSRRLTLYTDLPPSDGIDTLPAVFDQAFAQWCDYFHIDPTKYPHWKLTGCLIREKASFQRVGLMPKDLPPFPNGYSRGNYFWLYEQTNDYYCRHLALHEGTHSFMNTILGGSGPPWYTEGMAELMGTHHWQKGKLEMNIIPTSREESPTWGRIEIIQNEVAAKRPKSFESILAYGWQAHHRVEPYAWSWGVAVWLDRHPRYQKRFRKLYKNVLRPDFPLRFRQMMGNDWNELPEQWQMFIDGLEYGDDIPRTAIDFAQGKPFPSEGASVTVKADRGWQNSGLLLRGGTTYQLTAKGRYQVANSPTTWWCEPGGVSIRYYKGRPLGILMAAVHSSSQHTGRSVFLDPTVVGLQCRLKPKQNGTLFLKINDSAGQLHDNAGELRVEIKSIRP